MARKLLLDYRRIYKLRHFASLRDIKRKSGEKELATLLDLGKGFDLVQTCIIILSNRTHFIEKNGKIPGKLEYSVGVPQGSILGPLLDIVNLKKYLLHNSVLYATHYNKNKK